MMEEQGLEDDTPRVVVTVGMELYIRHKEDPISCNGTFRFAREHIENPADRLDNFMTIVTNTFSTALDNKQVTRLTLSDEKFNKFLIQTEDITTVTIHAPSMKTLDGLMEDE